MKRTDYIYDQTQLLDVLAGLKFSATIRDPSARITTYCADIFESLDEIGYGDFETENLKHTIYLIFERPKPPTLKSAMVVHLKVDAGLKKNVRLFFTRMNEDATTCEAFEQQVNATDTKKDDYPNGLNEDAGKTNGGGGTGARGKVSAVITTNNCLALPISSRKEN